MGESYYDPLLSSFVLYFTSVERVLALQFFSVLVRQALTRRDMLYLKTIERRFLCF